jgi:hypothetical protein
VRQCYHQQSSCDSMSKETRKAEKKADDFKSVARRIECDEDKETFERKLGKIARQKLTTTAKNERQQ